MYLRSIETSDLSAIDYLIIIPSSVSSYHCICIGLSDNSLHLHIHLTRLDSP